jgi:UDP-N-acetylglucosamine--N-acetylmuramyl-(pentapeptide) pyrophosphoryl-undecaprenol N-acetylglucosamine transferase
MNSTLWLDESRWSSLIVGSFLTGRYRSSRKGVVTGNPVHFVRYRLQRDRESFRFWWAVHKGSRSNSWALPQLKESTVHLRIKHQTGAADFEKVEAAYKSAGWNGDAEVRSYIDNMVDDFANADLVVCRAGATTTAELIAAGKAAVMIPFPLAADDHQRKNAEALVESGAARMICKRI